jgi:5-formyltetrahydrofolate cyclo-ligase
VIVTLYGGRLGKGTGYSDQEYVILNNVRSPTPRTPVVTTVHDIQIVENIPVDKWDLPVNMIVLPT